MSRIAFNKAEVRRKHLRREYVPIVSTILASLLALLPIIVSSPIIPDFAFLMLIAWRLLRPEMWGPVVALPLGLFNDLVAGHPIGQSMALWTMFFIIFDIIDSRVLFRDYWMDWLIAAAAIAAYIFADWYIGTLMGNQAEFSVMFPQLAASILAFPVVARFVLLLDRWRLAR
ncbi:rod shape-determining protein MreD [Allosphingosinicella sp.]|jgi:rod shape-determining protein MreD|uniref:rod shape-determining protein MreD n=1 Tax=Allosphingosinicella sp. TaxID=2823234 RepID=UPI002F014F1C